MNSTQDFINEVKGCLRENVIVGGDGTVDLSPLYNQIDSVNQSLEDHSNNDDIHTTVSEAAAVFSNPNLLINPDFSINQRGQTEYVGNSEVAIYSLDMWRLLGTVEVFNDYITISPENSVYGYGVCSQTVLTENVGKPFTISALINDEIVIASGVCGPEYIGFTGDGWNLRFVSLDETRISVEFIVYKKIKVAKPKLELGAVATPFVPPDPAVELVKCQRYLLELEQSSAYRAVAIGTDYIDFSIPTPTTMRPISGMSIINPENFVVRSINPTVDQTGFSFSVVTYGTNQLRLRALKTAHGLTDATLAVKSSSTAFLSAEL